MLKLLHEGGVSTLFILIIGIIGLGYAAFFAARPLRRRLRVVRAIGVTLLAATLAGSCAGFGAVFHAIPERFADKPDWPMIVLMGLGEVMSVGILGFALIAIIALVATLGVGRMADDGNP